MPDYGHDLRFGIFTTPTVQPAQHAVELAVLADQQGLDLATFQDHPYQPAFLDTWTLLSYAAAKTERIHLGGNVLSLPLRDPAVLARAVASLDRLSGGRVELGIGAGAFWDGIAAMGGRRRSAGEAVRALDEGLDVIRQVWDTSTRGGVKVEGDFYHVSGAKRGPAPAHEVEVWVGAYKPKMLDLVGRKATGWLPSLGYLPGGVADLETMNARIDAAAVAAGRESGDIRRMLNVNGQFAQTRTGYLQGPPEALAEDLAETALTYGVSDFILAADDPAAVELFATVIAPQTRELVAAGR